MIWKENIDKAVSDRVSGKNSKVNTATVQLTKKGKYVAKYHSISEASRTTGIPKSNISRCIKKERQTAGGFKWE